VEVYLVSGICTFGHIIDSIKQVEHLVVAIDILKLKCAIRSRKTTSDASPLKDVNDIDDLYRLPDIVVPLSSSDVLKISACMDSDNIILIRKATELIWINIEEIVHSADPETVCRLAQIGFTCRF
jgi:hypothetical protein